MIPISLITILKRSLFPPQPWMPALELKDISHIRLWNTTLKYHLVLHRAHFPVRFCCSPRAHAMICEDSGYTTSCLFLFVFLLLDYWAAIPKQLICLLDPFIYSAWIGAPLGMLFFKHKLYVTEDLLVCITLYIESSSSSRAAGCVMLI